jgi:hypothetical protein
MANTTSYRLGILGYIMFRKDRPEGRGGGGLLTYAKINNNIEYEEVFIEEHVFSGIEFMCINSKYIVLYFLSDLNEHFNA